MPAQGVATGPKLSKVQKFAFDLLKKLTDTESVHPPAGHNPLSNCPAVLSATWRERFYETYRGTSGTQKSGRFCARRSTSRKKAWFNWTLARVRMAADKGTWRDKWKCPAFVPLKRCWCPGTGHRDRPAGQKGQLFPEFVPLSPMSRPDAVLVLRDCPWGEKERKRMLRAFRTMASRRSAASSSAPATGGSVNR